MGGMDGGDALLEDATIRKGMIVMILGLPGEKFITNLDVLNEDMDEKMYIYLIVHPPTGSLNISIGKDII